MRERLLIFASVVLPLAYLIPNHYPPWTAFHADLAAAIALIPLMIWALWQRGPLPVAAIAIAALSFLPLMQVLAGQIRFAGDGWIAWLYLTGFAFAILAGARLTANDSRGSKALSSLTPLWTGLILAALISVGIAIHQWLDLGLLGLFIDEVKRGDRPYANFSQPNNLATLLMLGLAGTGFLYENKKLNWTIAIAAALVLSFGVALTQSRTPLLALALIWPTYLLTRRRASLRTAPKALLAVTAAFLLTVCFWQGLNRVLLLSDASSLAARMGENLRVILWQSMLEAVGRSPWVGYGWNQVGLAQQATALDFPATRYFFDSAHNLILDIALWAGLPVALAVAIGLFFWLVRQLAACRDPLSWWTLLAIVFVLCHAMVEYPLSYAYFLLPVGIFVGALSVGMTSDANRWIRSATLWPIFAVAGTSALMVFTMVSAEYVRFEEEWRQIRLGRILGAESKSDAPSQVTVLTQLQAWAQFAQMTPRRGMTREQLELMRRVAERYGFASITFKYAEALALNGDSGAAAIALEKLCKIQQPKACSDAISEWRSKSEGRYPEFRIVKLPSLSRP
jgi:O-antigen ligase